MMLSLLLSCSDAAGQSTVMMLSLLLCCSDAAGQSAVMMLSLLLCCSDAAAAEQLVHRVDILPSSLRDNISVFQRW